MKRARGPLAILAAGTVICLLLEYWAHARNEFFVIIGNRNLGGGWEGLACAKLFALGPATGSVLSTLIRPGAWPI